MARRVQYCSATSSTRQHDTLSIQGAQYLNGLFLTGTTFGGLTHEVFLADTFSKAQSLIEDEMFDIAVIDLGWYTDEDLKNQQEEVGAAGWALARSVKHYNPNTVRILYSARVDDPNIAETATREGIYCIQKRFTDEGRQNLADVVKVIAHRLSIEADLRTENERLANGIEMAQEKIRQSELSSEANINQERDRLKLELEKTQVVLKELSDKNQDKNNRKIEAEQRFRRVLITVVLVPTVSVVLLIVAWLLTEQSWIAILAFVISGFLVLATLRATNYLSSKDLKYLGGLLNDLSTYDNKTGEGG